jgi:hypothetical protein
MFSAGSECVLGLELGSVRWGTSAQRANRPELNSGDGGCGRVGIRERARDLDLYREHC